MVSVFQDQTRDVPQRAGVGEHPRGGGGRYSIRERVLGRARLESRGETGQHGRVTEHLADIHQIQDLTITDDLHAAGADHAQRLDRLYALGEDDLARTMEFDLYDAAEAR